MPRLTDPNEIRRRLERDRGWALYALADLFPGFFAASDWYASETDADVLALVYRGAALPILFATGLGEELTAVLAELPPGPQYSVSIRPVARASLRTRWRLRDLVPMWRMLLDPQAEVPSPTLPVRRLGSGDLEALHDLYHDGDEAGEAPDFFAPRMLAEGTFYGVWEGPALIAAAGTHVVAPSEGVAAVGNVYVRRDSRGRGCAQAVTAAVVGELRDQGIPTIGLNVKQASVAAIRAYERVGFRVYCPFFEGSALRTHQGDTET